MPSDSELSSLSSAPPTDDEATMAIDHPTGIAKYFKKESETPPPKREPSPPHEYVLADNPDIAVSSPRRNILCIALYTDMYTTRLANNRTSLLSYRNL